LNFFTSKIDTLKMQLQLFSKIAQFNLSPHLPDPTHSGELSPVMTTVTFGRNTTCRNSEVARSFPDLQLYMVRAYCIYPSDDTKVLFAQADYKHVSK